MALACQFFIGMCEATWQAQESFHHRGGYNEQKNSSRNINESYGS